MADPTQITEYTNNRRLDADNAIIAAQQKLATAGVKIDSERAKLANVTNASAQLEKQAAGIREELSAITTPADGTALLNQLEQTIIRTRTTQFEILKGQSELLAAQRAAASAGSELAVATAELAEARLAFNQATVTSKLRLSLINALRAAPLSTIKTDATNALNDAAPEGANLNNANLRIKAELPEKLVVRAKARRNAEADRLTDTKARMVAAENAILAEQDKNQGLAAQAADFLARLKRVEAAASEFVNTAKVRFDEAQAALARIGDPTFSPLTADQAARVNDSEPTLKAAREAAANAEKVVTDLLKDWQGKQALLDAAILTAISDPTDETRQAVIDKQKDVEDARALFIVEDGKWRLEERDRDLRQEEVAASKVALGQAIQKAIARKQNPDTDLAVQSARASLTDAEIKLAAAEETYRKSPHGILHAWEAAVPDTTWRLLDDYEAAVATLTDLKNSDPAQLATDLQTAESEYVAAQLKADASANVVARLTSEKVQREAQQESVQTAGAALLFSALRGDN